MFGLYALIMTLFVIPINRNNSVVYDTFDIKTADFFMNF